VIHRRDTVHCSNQRHVSEGTSLFDLCVAADKKLRHSAVVLDAHVSQWSTKHGICNTHTHTHTHTRELRHVINDRLTSDAAATLLTKSQCEQ